MLQYSVNRSKLEGDFVKNAFLCSFRFPEIEKIGPGKENHKIAFIYKWCSVPSIGKAWRRLYKKRIFGDDKIMDSEIANANRILSIFRQWCFIFIIFCMQKSVKIRKRMKVIEMIHVPFFAILFFHNLGFQKDHTIWCKNDKMLFS